MPSNRGILRIDNNYKATQLFSMNLTYVKTNRSMSWSIEYPGGNRRRFESQIVRNMQDFTSKPKLKEIVSL